MIGRKDRRDCQVEPSGLCIHHCDQWKISLVVNNGSAGDLLQTLGACNMVDVRMGYKDLLHRQLMFRKQQENPRNIISRVQHDGLMRHLIAKDGTVATKQPDREGFTNHRNSVLTPKAEAQASSLRFADRSELRYFFAGVVWLGTSESTERLLLLCDSTTVSAIEVSMKMIAAQVVRRVSRLAAPRGPKAVCEPCPPKAPARSADLPC